MRLNEEKLQARIEAGQVTARDLRRALASEMNTANSVTMPTLGVDAATRTAEAGAEAKLQQMRDDASHNIPLLQRVLAGMGEAADLPTCKSCGKVHVGHGNTCSNCYEPSEY